MSDKADQIREQEHAADEAYLAQRAPKQFRQIAKAGMGQTLRCANCGASYRLVGKIIGQVPPCHYCGAERSVQ